MSLLDDNSRNNANLISRLVEIVLLVCTVVYVFAVTDSRSIANEKNLREFKQDISTEMLYIRARVDYLIELQLKNN